MNDDAKNLIRRKEQEVYFLLRLSLSIRVTLVTIIEMKKQKISYLSPLSVTHDRFKEKSRFY